MKRGSWIAGMVIAMVAAYATVLVAGLPAYGGCGAEVTNQTHQGPTVLPMTTPEFTRTEPGENCCSPAQQPNCQNKSASVTLKIHWKCDGSPECRVGVDWPGGSCHSDACFSKFAYVTQAPGEGDKDDGTYSWSVPCKRRISKSFQYDEKMYEEESFHYKGWCKITIPGIGDVVDKSTEQDCFRDYFEKREHVIQGSGVDEDCSNEPACQGGNP
jgi:hypothetical protein